MTLTQVVAAPPRGTLSLSASKEQLSIAYVRAVIAAAQCTSASGDEPDVDCVDLSVRQVVEHDVYDHAQVDLQLKATAQTVVSGSHIALRLTKDHYDRLKNPKVYVPRVLVVLVLPPTPQKWLYQHDRAMLLRNCAYWMSLRNFRDISTDSTTVHVPLAQPFTVNELLAMLQRVGRGGTP